MNQSGGAPNSEQQKQVASPLFPQPQMDSQTLPPNQQAFAQKQSNPSKSVTFGGQQFPSFPSGQNLSDMPMTSSEQKQLHHNQQLGQSTTTQQMLSLVNQMQQPQQQLGSPPYMDSSPRFLQQPPQPGVMSTSNDMFFGTQNQINNGQATGRVGEPQMEDGFFNGFDLFNDFLNSNNQSSIGDQPGGHPGFEDAMAAAISPPDVVGGGGVFMQDDPRIDYSPRQRESLGQEDEIFQDYQRQIPAPPQPQQQLPAQSQPIEPAQQTIKLKINSTVKSPALPTANPLVQQLPNSAPTQKGKGLTEPSRQQRKQKQPVAPPSADEDIAVQVAPLATDEKSGVKRKIKMTQKDSMPPAQQLQDSSSAHHPVQLQARKDSGASGFTNMEPPDEPPASMKISRREWREMQDKEKSQKTQVVKQPRQKLSRSDSRQRRLEKNRQSARESRKRKKTYIEALELKLDMVQNENVKLRTQNQNLRERKKINFLSNLSQIDEFLSGRQELYERLSSTVQEGATEQEIRTIIECLRQRSGTYGVQRKELINNLFKGIVDLSFPQFVKYLFWGSTNNLGMFENESCMMQDHDEQGVVKQGNQPSQKDSQEMEFDDKQMMFSAENSSEQLNDQSSSLLSDDSRKRMRRRVKTTQDPMIEKLTKEQVSEFISITDDLCMTDAQKSQFKEHKQVINESKQKFKNLIDRLIDDKTKFMQELQNLEKTTDKLKDILSPDQTAKYLIFVEKLKSKSTLNIFNLWGLRKIGEQSKGQGSAEKADRHGIDSQSSRSFQQLQDEMSHQDFNDDMSNTNSLDGLPHSDGDGDSMSDEEVTLTNQNPTALQIKKGRSTIDLKAAKLDYYGGGAGGKEID